MDRDQHTYSKVVWWAFWLWLLVGTVLMFSVFGKNSPPPRPSQTASLLWTVALVPVLLSLLIRWLVLPRFGRTNLGLVAFLIGLSFAELPSFLGLFVFPWHKVTLFVASVLSIVLFIPAGIFTARKPGAA